MPLQIFAHCGSVFGLERVAAVHPREEFPVMTEFVADRVTDACLELVSAEMSVKPREGTVVNDDLPAEVADAVFTQRHEVVRKSFGGDAFAGLYDHSSGKLAEKALRKFVEDLTDHRTEIIDVGKTIFPAQGCVNGVRDLSGAFFDCFVYSVQHDMIVSRMAKGSQ